MFEQDKGFEAYMKSLNESESVEAKELDNEISEEESTEVEQPETEFELDNTPEEDGVDTETDESVVEEESEEDIDDEVEESEEAEEESEVEVSEEDEDYYSVDGIEITKSRLEKLIALEKESKDSEFRLSDYTKKSQENKELKESLEAERKELEAEREFAKKIISDKIMTEEQLQEFGEEYGFEEYQRVLKEQKQLKEDLNKFKESSVTASQQSQEERIAEIEKAYEVFPNYFKVEDGKIVDYSEEFTEAKTEMTTHMKEIGATDNDIAKIGSATMFKLVQDSMELKKLKATKEDIKKKVKKAVIVPKGAPKQTTSKSQRIQKAQKAYDRNPTRENYLALERAKLK